MRRFAIAVAACLLLASAVAPVSAAKPATRGFLPANATPHGHSLVDLATAWNAWSLAALPDSSAFLAGRCEESPIDPRIWFLPEPYPGGRTTATCDLPQGAFLVFSPFFIECSSAEPAPFFGADETELRACVAAGFDLLSAVELTFNGQTVSAADLADYVVTTRLDEVSAPNLVNPDPSPTTLTMNKGFFMVIAPLSRGTHMISANWVAMGYSPAITFEIIVH